MEDALPVRDVMTRKIPGRFLDAAPLLPKSRRGASKPNKNWGHLTSFFSFPKNPIHSEWVPQPEQLTLNEQANGAYLLFLRH
jgi:hypothetical protein